MERAPSQWDSDSLVTCHPGTYVPGYELSRLRRIRVRYLTSVRYEPERCACAEAAPTMWVPAEPATASYKCS